MKTLPGVRALSQTTAVASRRMGRGPLFFGAPMVLFVVLRYLGIRRERREAKEAEDDPDDT